MAVFVDDMRRTDDGGTLAVSCHMMADTSWELEVMRKMIGLRREWIHGDHYDLTAAKRILAIKNGAVAADARSLVRLRQRNRTKIA